MSAYSALVNVNSEQTHHQKCENRKVLVIPITSKSEIARGKNPSAGPAPVSSSVQAYGSPTEKVRVYFPEVAGKEYLILLHIYEFIS